MVWVIQRGLESEKKADTMTSQAGHHGRGLQLYPNQCFENIKTAGKNVLSRLRTSFQVLSSICFRWQLLLFLCTMAFMLTHAHGQMQTGACNLTDPAIIWDRSSVVNPETIGLCPCSSAEQLPMKWVNSCIPHGHLNVENLSPDPLWTPSPSGANVKVVVVTTVLAIFGEIGLVGLAGWLLYKRRRAFTEADINRGLMRGPVVARRSNPTFEIPLHID